MCYNVCVQPPLFVQDPIPSHVMSHVNSSLHVVCMLLGVYAKFGQPTSLTDLLIGSWEFMLERPIGLFSDMLLQASTADSSLSLDVLTNDLGNLSAQKRICPHLCPRLTCTCKGHDCG